MPTGDLVYDSDCPNITIARSNLVRAFAKVGISASWSEHRIGAAETPTRVRGTSESCCPGRLTDSSCIVSVPKNCLGYVHWST